MDDLLDIADFREQCPPLLDRLVQWNTSRTEG